MRIAGGAGFFPASRKTTPSGLICLLCKASIVRRVLDIVKKEPCKMGHSFLRACLRADTHRQKNLCNLCNLRIKNLYKKMTMI